MITSRRNILRAFGLGAATLAVAPVRRVWQVGAQLERPPAVSNTVTGAGVVSVRINGVEIPVRGVEIRIGDPVYLPDFYHGIPDRDRAQLVLHGGANSGGKAAAMTLEDQALYGGARAGGGKMEAAARQRAVYGRCLRETVGCISVSDAERLKRELRDHLLAAFPGAEYLRG